MARLGSYLTAIRPMVMGDLDTILGIERTTFPEPWPKRVFHEELRGPSRSYLVAENEDEIAGYAGMMAVGDEAHITTIAVVEELQGEGIGTRLMLALIDEALRGHARNLTLEVRVSNRRAQRLYRRFGFAPVGIRRDYYRTEDALIMWAEGIQGPEYQTRLERIRSGPA